MREMKWYLPPIMKNTFWNSLMDSIEEVIDDLKAQKIETIKTLYSLSESSESELIDIAHTIYQLDSFMLDKLLDFLTELELYHTSDYDRARARALERLRQEIMKIPFSMSKRGTLEYYASILEFCDFNYPGVITLTKTEGDNRVLPLFTNINLQTPYDSSRTELINPPVNENFSGTEDIMFSTLDQLLTRPDGSTYYETLDSDTETGTGEGESFEERRAILDLTSASDLSSANLYRKVLMIGLRITETTAMYYSTGALVGHDDGNPDYYYPGAPTFPENLGRYYQSFINLNKRATDVLLFGPFLALNIIQSETSSGIDSVIPDSRLTVRTLSSVGEASSGFRFRYYDTAYIEGESEDFYEEDLYNYVFTPASKEEEESTATLTVFGICQGEFCRRIVEAQQSSDNERVQFKIPKKDWSTSMIFRAYSSVTPDSYYLLYLDSYGVIIQRYNNTGSQSLNLIAQIDTESDPLYNTVYLSGSAGTSIPFGLIDRVVYMSQRLHSSVKTIRLMSYDSNDAETEIARLEFKENTQIEICRDITLFTYLCIHFDGTASGQTEDLAETE